MSPLLFSTNPVFSRGMRPYWAWWLCGWEAWSSWVCGDDARAGADLEAQFAGRLKQIDRRSVQIRRHTWRRLPCLPGCTSSTEVWPRSAATVSHRHSSTWYIVPNVRKLFTFAEERVLTIFFIFGERCFIVFFPFVHVFNDFLSATIKVRYYII